MIPIYKTLPKQIIHRDIHPGNILFQGKKLSGFIDFELSLKTVRIFDPCYCATSILIAGFEDREKREVWLELFIELLQGYGMKNKLTKEELGSLIYILYSIELIFIGFSCDNDMIDAARYNQKVLKWLYGNKGLIKNALKNLE